VAPTDKCNKHFPDDGRVADEVRLLRRIPPWHFVADANDDTYRPSSAAFDDDADGDPMSVYRADVIDAEGGQPARVMIGHDDFGLVSLAAGTVRKKDQTVYPAPVPGETSHTKVCGRKAKGTRRHFARLSEWVIPPPA